MTPQRPDVSVLSRGARAHRPLAQIDLFKVRARGRRVVVEERALRDCQSYCTFNVARNQLVAALEPLVKTFQHALRLLAGVARAFDGDVVTALIHDHAKPTFDQSEVLSVLAE